MRYIDFRDSIRDELLKNPKGLTWPELKKRLDLPYQSPCYEWLARMEQEIGLYREKGDTRAFIWKVKKKR